MTPQVLRGGGASCLIEHNGILFTPSTLRYIKVLADLCAHFGDLNTLRICEIGVGYGAQARIALSKFPKIHSYSFIDLASVLKLTQKYLTHFSDISANLAFLTLDKLPEQDYDLVISNYAFSELNREIQELYIAKVIRNAKHGYITYNDISNENLGSIKIENYATLFDKPIKILPEVPLTHPKNKIVVW